MSLPTFSHNRTPKNTRAASKDLLGALGNRLEITAYFIPNPSTQDRQTLAGMAKDTGRRSSRPA